MNFKNSFTMTLGHMHAFQGGKIAFCVRGTLIVRCIKSVVNGSFLKVLRIFDRRCLQA